MKERMSLALLKYSLLFKSDLNFSNTFAFKDTIYGLACLACNTAALNKIYQIKGRNLEKPLAISVGKTDDLIKYKVIELNRLNQII